MTRDRALKQVIRARAARTGERYTTARRHVLNNLKPRRPGNAAPAPPPASPTPAAAVLARATRGGGVSEVKLAERTGHGLAHWFEVLDRFDAVTKGHTAAARHLHDAHGVDGWYAQGITVAYERARGIRAVNQRLDGAYEVSVSKVIAADTAAVIATLATPRQRRRLNVSDEGLLRALAAALDAPNAKGFVVRPDGQGRFRYRWNETIVQFYLVPKGGKVSVVVTNMKLGSVRMVEERRAAWREMLDSLAAVLARR